MDDNRIQASLSQADRDAVMAAVAAMRQKPPFLTDLSPEERRALPKMGDRSWAFVSGAMGISPGSAKEGHPVE